MSEEGRKLLSVQGDESRSGLARPLLFSLIAALGPLLFGYTIGFTSPLGKVLQDSDKGIGISSGENSLFGSLINVGAMFGAIMGGYLTDKISRRGAIQVACLPFVGGYILISTAKSLVALFFGRVLTGLAVGIVSLAVPVYIAEISPASLRGGLGSINQLAVTIGILVSYAIGIGVTWRILALIGAIMGGGLLAGSLLLPRTPRWLVAHNNVKEARRSLVRLRGQNSDIDAELSEIENALREAAKLEGGASFADLFRGAAGRAMIVGVALMLYQQFSGINAVMFYCQSIFEDAGMSNADISALSASAVQVVITFVSCLIVDKAGRRVLLMCSGMGLTSSTAILGYYFYCKDHDNPISGSYALGAVLIYIASFALGLGAIPWLMMSEIFPGRVRGMASSAATLLNWSCSFIVTETFDSMKSALTEGGTFWFYSVVCALGVMYVLLLAPETKGRTLEQIESFFNGDRAACDGGSQGTDLVKITCLTLMLIVGLIVMGTSL